MGIHHLAQCHLGNVLHIHVKCGVHVTAVNLRNIGHHAGHVLHLLLMSASGNAAQERVKREFQTVACGVLGLIHASDGTGSQGTERFLARYLGLGAVEPHLILGLEPYGLDQ